MCRRNNYKKPCYKELNMNEEGEDEKKEEEGDDEYYDPTANPENNNNNDDEDGMNLQNTNDDNSTSEFTMTACQNKAVEN